MVEEALKPTVIPLHGKLVTAKDQTTLQEGDFQTLTNMRYKRKNPISVLGMTKYNTATVVDGTASPGTYMKTRQGFHFKKDSPSDLGSGYVASVADCTSTDTVPTWNVTIDNTVAYTARLKTKLALDVDTNTFYVSLGTHGEYNGDAWLIWKRNMDTGGAIWQLIINEIKNSCVQDISFYDGYLYISGNYHGGYADESVQLARYSSDGDLDWQVDTGVNKGRGGAVCADSSGIYLAVWENDDDLWYIQKYDTDGNQTWSVTSDHGSAYPYEIVSDASYIYVFGSGAEWIAEKRDKTDGSLTASRVNWNTGSAAGINCACTPTATTVTVGGHDYGASPPGYRGIVETLSTATADNFSTSVSVTREDSYPVTGIDRCKTDYIFTMEAATTGANINSQITQGGYSDLVEDIRVEDINTFWSGVASIGDIKLVEKVHVGGSVIVATPTYSATGGAHADVIIQRREGWSLDI